LWAKRWKYNAPRRGGGSAGEEERFFMGASAQAACPGRTRSLAAHDQPLRHAICRRWIVVLRRRGGGRAIIRILKGISMINIIVWLVVGGLIGWVASLIMKTDAQQGIFLNIVVGIVGAAVAGWLISPLIGVPSINQNVFSVGAFIVSLLGAIVLLGIVNLIRRGTPRS